MAAGQGFKTFTTGEVLTAGDVNGYLMQGINVFASTAARDAAITSPQEGQFAFTKDTNGLWYYDGAAWVASGATGDIEGVTAGIGISGGGTSGTVTITNSMATAIDAKGDLVAGTGADAFSRLAVGANNTVLTADSSTATGLKWSAPSAGANWTLLNAGGTGLSGSTTTVSGISGADKIMILLTGGVSSTSASSDISFRLNSDSGANYAYTGTRLFAPAAYSVSTIQSDSNLVANQVVICQLSNNQASRMDGYVTITGCNSSGVKAYQSAGGSQDGSGSSNNANIFAGYYNSSSAISSISILSSIGTFDRGTVYVYTSA